MGPEDKDGFVRWSTVDRPRVTFLRLANSILGSSGNMEIIFINICIP